MMNAEPQEGHRWLQRLLGEWNYELEGGSEAGDEAKKARGTESVRALGDLWILAEGQGQMGGGDAQTLMTLGYDPQKGKFVGSWIGSMMTHLWVYEGVLDASGAKLTLETEGPDFGGSGKMAPYRDTIEFLSDDHRTLTGSTKGEDGQWTQFMVTHYYRKR